MTDNSDTPSQNSKQSQNNFDYLAYEKLHKIFGSTYDHPFDHDIERTIAYLHAYSNYLRSELSEESEEVSKVSGLISQWMEIEFSDRRNPSIFYDFFSGKTVFHLPRKENESIEDAEYRRFEALRAIWPSMRTGNIQVAAEIIRLMGPNARENLLKKFASKGGHDEKEDSSGR